MKKFVINEKISTRGMNNLFYEIEIWSKNEETGKYSYKKSLSYMRADVDKVHELQEFKNIQKINNQDINDAQAEELIYNFSKLFNSFGKLK